MTLLEFLDQHLFGVGFVVIVVAFLAMFPLTAWALAPRGRPTRRDLRGPR